MVELAAPRRRRARSVTFRRFRSTMRRSTPSSPRGCSTTSPISTAASPRSPACCSRRTARRGDELGPTEHMLGAAGRRLVDRDRRSPRSTATSGESTPASRSPTSSDRDVDGWLTIPMRTRRVDQVLDDVGDRARRARATSLAALRSGAARDGLLLRPRAVIHPAELIERKRNGGEHDPAELEELILGYARDEVPDYQMAAWCMAVYFNGLTGAETDALTDAMIRSGDDARPRRRARPQGRRQALDRRRRRQDLDRRRADRRRLRRAAREDERPRARPHGRHARQARVDPRLPGRADDGRDGRAAARASASRSSGRAPTSSRPTRSSTRSATSRRPSTSSR